MSSELQFCKHCNTLLVSEPLEDDGTSTPKGVRMKCTNCSYERDVQGNHIIYSHNIKAKNNTTIIDMATLYDSAVKRTSRTRCPIPDCKANNPEYWGQLNDKGIIIQPDVMVINYSDTNRISTFLCRTCGSMSKAAATV